MKNLFLLFVFPVILFAGNINLSFNNHNGQSSYKVYSNNVDNLKSELIFPFNFNSLDVSYAHIFKYFYFNIHSSFLLNSRTQRGEDFDWQNDNLTVYSQSKNEINNFYNIGMKINKNLSNNIDLFVKFNYEILDMKWSSTYEEDYVKGTNAYIVKNTLKFHQEFYKYYLGLQYTYNISKNISLNLAPSIIYAYINTKDTHILRDFSTTQNTQSLGYEISSQLSYKMDKKSDFNISVNHILLEDKNTNMDYYNKLNVKYLTYPSSYNYKNITISIHYNYLF